MKKESFLQYLNSGKKDKVKLKEDKVFINPIFYFPEEYQKNIAS